MKRKILFYGNCQVGAVARFFRLHLSDKFDVQLCNECGLSPFWSEPGLFAVWSPENREKQQEYLNCIHSKISESDVFVFQPHYGGRWLMNELQTEYLHNTVAQGVKICLPDTRFFIYLSDKVSLQPFTNYVKTKVNSKEEIINYLKTSDDPNLTAMLKNEYPFNLEFKQYRNENRQRYEESVRLYDNTVNMCDFLETEYTTKQVAVTHNHMAKSYYADLIIKMCTLLDINSSNLTFENLEFPGQGVTTIDPRQFNFWMNVFSTIPFDSRFSRQMTVDDIE